MSEKGQGVAFFDLDKTIYKEHSFFPFADYLVDCNILDPNISTELHRQVEDFKEGKISYQEASDNTLKITGKYLKGLQYSEVKTCAKDFFELNKEKFFPYFSEIVPEFRKLGIELILVTNTNQMMAQAVVEMFELDGFLSTEFEVENGVFTGNISRSFAGGKVGVSELLKGKSKDYESSFAFGDSLNDIGLLEIVGHPVCINPSKDLLDVANNRKWKVLTPENAAIGILGLLKEMTGET